ncbi:MAG: PKD domain-containing protein [Bacteroidales bacterium]|nr:MAG: PKD domain-containing protein [Bacteroidales bacterium]
MSLTFTAFPQTDVEFWFVAPEITESHGIFPGGEPIYFRVSAMDLPSTVRIYQPARPAGLDTTFNVPANSTVSIDVTPFVNDLENDIYDTPLDKGIHITATNLITVYYDEDEFYNRDIYALKGRNGLGMEFYAPFNDIWRNGIYNPVVPYSAIDIVATEDNTQITITPTAAVKGVPVDHPAGIPYVITLNRGETYSARAVTQLAADHLGGTHITSNKPIAVSIKDDSVWAEPQGCKDLIGDQVVPVRRVDNRRIVGYEYIVMRGKINLINPAVDPTDGVPSGERVFILATQPNTQVFVNGAFYSNIAFAGQQVSYELSQNSTHIAGDKPIYVLHVSGFGCEFGGAVLPTIDGCTGSLEVSFTRSTNEGFYLNIMTLDAAKDNFTMHYEDGSTFNIPANWFEPVGATGFVCLKEANKQFANGTGGGVPQNEVVKITNSESVFHLGLIEGGRTTGCKYGYFSDYAESRGEALVVESGSQSIGRCFGDTVQLRASGGLTYTWSPSDYLSDPFIATPIAAPPPGVYNYTVTITRACFPDTSFTIIVGISTEIEGYFEMDKWYICAPDQVTIDNQSFGVDMSDTLNVQWDFDLDDPFNGYVYDTNTVFLHTFTNTTDTIQRKTIQLLVWNQHGCTDEFQRDIMVRPEINAGFTTNVVDGCQPVTVDFTNTSTGNTDRYKWDLGDGNYSNDVSPSHTYYNFGMADSIYHVEMVAISPFYCTDTAETDISVYPYLEADFAVDTVRGCSPFTISIENNSAGYIEEYEWDLGDGNFSNTSAASFFHTYVNATGAPVQHILQLVVKNNTRGCMDTISRIITVYPEVTSAFTQDNIIGCHPLGVNFTNQSSATATMFEWDFGDGGSSSDTDPFHLFENFTLVNANYTVRLVSTTPDLCRDTSYQNIVVHPYIHADFSVNDFEGCAPFQITVDNAATGAISGYEWDWGDGTPGSTSGAATLTHLYQNNGPAPVVYPLRLVVENADGCTDTLIRDITVYPVVISQFTQDVTEGCNPLGVQFTNQSNVYATSFMWEFGDGGSSDEQDPYHLFENFTLVNTTHTTKLIAYSDHNCTDTSEVNITVYSKLKADFTFDLGSSCTPFDVTFNNSSLGGVQYHWDFGDGNDTTVLNINPVTHRYTNPSPTLPVTYEVILTVWNANNCTDELRRDVVVYPVVRADFSADASIGCHPFTVNFTNNSTGASTYNWDFGNGQSSDDTNPVMVFENYSLNDTTFNVELVATNTQSCTDTFSIPITVRPYVEADFTIEYTSRCTPFDVTIYNSSINGQQYDWSFDGTPYSTTSGAPISRQFVNTSYTNTQVFTIDLLVTSPQGCTSSLSRDVSVFHAVNADYTSITEGCNPLIVDFTNTSQGGDEYNWEFGDNGSSIVESPSHTYSNLSNVDSVYNVKLLVTSADLCRDSTYGQITVYATPKADFIADNTVDCPPVDITIQNTTDGGDTFTWNFGDGSPPYVTNNLNPIIHTYNNTNVDIVTYELRLHSITANGCEDSISQNINVYPSIIVDFERDSAGCSPYFSEFTNYSVRASQYSWDFGDGITSALTHPSHTYFNNTVNDEVYDVTLVGTSKYGCIDSITKQVTVYPMPHAEFNATPVYQYYPDVTVNLENETNAGFWNFEWQFGDGNSSTLDEPGSHDYATWGEYNISLKAWSSQCEDSIEHRIRIFPPLPVAAFVPSVNAGCMPLTVTFTNNSIYGNSYYWDFDDGGRSTDFEPTHTFYDAGIYQIMLQVEGEGGVDYYFAEINVYTLPYVDFKVEPSLVMLPDQPVKVFNFSEYGERYLWDFGDGGTSDEKELSYQYTEVGVYDISLTVWTEHDCVDSMFMPGAVTVEGEGYIIFPNAFFPNQDQASGGYYSPTSTSNDVFHPLYEGVEIYTLQIFTRWGEFIFESNDPAIGWDGYYEGQICKQDVYVYKAVGKFYNGVAFDIAGDVTLLLRK